MDKRPLTSYWLIECWLPHLNQMKNRENHVSLEKTLLLAKICTNVAFVRIFLKWNYVNIYLDNWRLRSRLYIIAKPFFTTKQIKLIRKKKFVAAVFYPKEEMFVVHIQFIAIFNEIYPFSKDSIASLKINEVFIIVLP